MGREKYGWNRQQEQDCSQLHRTNLLLEEEGSQVFELEERNRQQQVHGEHVLYSDNLWKWISYFHWDLYKPFCAGSIPFFVMCNHVTERDMSSRPRSQLNLGQCASPPSIPPSPHVVGSRAAYLYIQHPPTYLRVLTYVRACIITTLSMLASSFGSWRPFFRNVIWHSL